MFLNLFIVKKYIGGGGEGGLGIGLGVWVFTVRAYRDEKSGYFSLTGVRGLP